MKKITRTLLLGAALSSIVAPAAEASRSARPARTSATSSPRQPNRVVRFLTRPFQRTRTSVRSQAGRQAARTVRPEARAEIEYYKQDMESAILGNATPALMLINMSPDVSMRQTRQSSYKQRITAAFKVSGLRGKPLPVTALMPVSGHVGQAEAARYARSNVYNVEIEYADGSKETSQFKATGYVTEHPMQINLKKGTNFVRIWPDDPYSSVGGFLSGREIEIEYDGK